jgi:hypothetical protein
MSVGGVGGEGKPYMPGEKTEPSGSAQGFKLPSNWQNKINDVMDQINPDEPQNVEKAIATLKEIASDQKTPQNVKDAANKAINQVNEGYMNSQNPIDLVQPYLTLAHVAMPIGPSQS